MDLAELVPNEVLGRPTRKDATESVSLDIATKGKKNWKPSMLRRKWLMTFLITLVAIAVILLVLRKFARELKLSRSAFTYQINLRIFDSSFSPHSVIATLIAVLVGLSWDAIDSPIRNLQPYPSSSRNSISISRGAPLSYQSSY